MSANIWKARFSRGARLLREFPSFCPSPFQLIALKKRGCFSVSCLHAAMQHNKALLSAIQFFNVDIKA